MGLELLLKATDQLAAYGVHSSEEQEGFEEAFKEGLKPRPL